MAAADRELRQSVLTRYKAERPLYEALSQATAGRLRKLAGQAGIPCQVTARAKDVASFSKKMITKHYGDPWRDITDKSGVRVTALYSKDVPRLRDLVVAEFPDNPEIKDFSEQLPAEQLAYLGIHVTVNTELGPGDDADRVPCEIQLRTFAQGAWAEMSHHLLYKPELQTSETVRRSLYRLVALMEIFDAEVERAMAELTSKPGQSAAQLLALAEPVFYQHRPDDFNRELSLLVLNDVSHTIVNLDDYPARLRSFTEAKDVRIESILSRYADDTSVPLLSQPEAIVLFERLDNDADSLRDAWTSLPVDLLEDVEAAWGHDIF